MKRKAVMRLMAVVLACSVIAPSFSGLAGNGVSMLTVEAAEGLGINGSISGVTFDPSSTWDEKKDPDSGVAASLSLTAEEAPAVGTKVQMDVLLPVSGNADAPTFAGKMKVGAIYRIGGDWQ